MEVLESLKTGAAPNVIEFNGMANSAIINSKLRTILSDEEELTLLATFGHETKEETEIPEIQTALLPAALDNKKQEDLMQEFIDSIKHKDEKSVKGIPRVTIEVNDVINEWDPYMLLKAFPYLFPYGTGGKKNRA